MLEPDLAPFSFLPKPTTNTSTEPGAAWRAVLCKSLSLVSVYGAPAECRPSTFMPALWVFNALGELTLWAQGSHWRKTGCIITVLGTESIRTHLGRQGLLWVSNTTCLGVFKRTRWKRHAAAPPETRSTLWLLCVASGRGSRTWRWRWGRRARILE